MKVLLITVSLLCTYIAFGQTKTETEQKPFIEVTGTAEQEIIPDEIYINIVIREKYVNREKITIESQEEKLKAALKQIEVDLKNLYLSDANADYVKIKWKTKDVLTKKEFVLKVSTATTVGQVFQQLDNIEITDAYIARVNHSKIDSLRKDIKIKAIKAAKDKADYLLAAIGEQTGKPLIIQEREGSYASNVTSNYVGQLNEVAMLGHVYNRAKADGETDIQFKKIKVQSTIYIKFLIK